MTRMLPPTVHSSIRSGAERKLFEVIRDAPGTDAWACIHSLGLARHSHKRRAEIDFALLTPEAILVLEVKGGRVERRDGRWTHTDRYGVAHSKNESPFDQASSAMFTLESDLQERFGSSRPARVLLGFAVMFPDVEYNSLGVEVDRQQVYDRRDAGRPFTRWVRELVDYTRKRQNSPRYGLDKVELELVLDYLRGDFELIPGFDVTADDVNRALTRLTRQQAACLVALDQQPRMLVEGAAGTGKSMLAIEIAKRESAAGKRTLLLCFNRMLAAKLGEIARRAAPSVIVHHAHDFMRTVIARSSVASEFERACAASPDARKKYDVVYPEFASLALAETEERFDAVVIDEAQDLLSPPFVEVLDQAVSGGIEAGRWRIFLDGNEQASVYGKLDESALARLRKVAPTTLLAMNCRNTRQIGLATRAIARPRAAAAAQHPGEHVDRRWYGDARTLATEVRAVLGELTDRRVPPSSVSVLYARLPDGLERLLEREGVRPLTVEYVPLLGTPEGRAVTHATASSFKGLENDVIVLVGVENLDDQWWRAVTYVAMSRARVKLYVLVHEDLRRTVDTRFEEIFREAMMEEVT